MAAIAASTISSCSDVGTTPLAAAAVWKKSVPRLTPNVAMPIARVEAQIDAATMVAHLDLAGWRAVGSATDGFTAPRYAPRGPPQVGYASCMPDLTREPWATIVPFLR